MSVLYGLYPYPPAIRATGKWSFKHAYSTSSLHEESINTMQAGIGNQCCQPYIIGFENNGCAAKLLQKGGLQKLT